MFGIVFLTSFSTDQDETLGTPPSDSSQPTAPNKPLIQGWESLRRPISPKNRDLTKVEITKLASKSSLKTTSNKVELASRSFYAKTPTNIFATHAVRIFWEFSKIELPWNSIKICISSDSAYFFDSVDEFSYRRNILEKNLLLGIQLNHSEFWPSGDGAASSYHFKV